MGIEVIEKISHKYGSNPEFVLAGGGNTSFKDESNLYIKGSGASLATITREGFVKMSRQRLAEIWNKTYSKDKDEREAQVLCDMMASRCVGEESKRPSVETLLHNLFAQSYVLHVHPSVINGLTCSQHGGDTIQKILPDAIWVEETEPGYVLAAKCREKIKEYEKNTKERAHLLFLQNHGIFFAADSEEEMDSLVLRVVDALKKQIKDYPDFTEKESDFGKVNAISPVLRLLYNKEGRASVKFTLNQEIERLCKSREAFSVLEKPLSPDHIVYCKAMPLFLEEYGIEYIRNAFSSFEKANRYLPKAVFVKNVGMFAIGNTPNDAITVTDVWLDAIKISVYAKSFGGIRHMADEMVDFIANWEVERYRSKVALNENVKRFTGKIAVVTGGARGLGREIASYFVENGACVLIADLNIELAIKVRDELIAKYGKGLAEAVLTDVKSEGSVKMLINKAVALYGGIDIFINNAGIIKAGGIDEISFEDFKAINDVNYNAYFLCVKYASSIMKLQREVNMEYISDIIEINSKSGLCGSAKNFPYSGSKFGGIGLTQSFAMELAPFGIKVNAICPGNYLDGELWSDPENGLFVQYLRAGKVEGAKTVEDVRRYYEGKVPLGRGCEARDVCVAVAYAVEQKYETGQAIPVTGGQIMLK